MLEYYKKILKKLDFNLLSAIGIIILIGLFILNSATSHKSFPYVQRQIIWIFVSIFVALIILRMDYSVLSKYSKHLYALNIGLLLAVMVFGSDIKGARSWIQIKHVGSLQPSEFCKILTIITFAQYLVTKQGKLEKLKDLIPAFIFVAIPAFLIFIEPDLGTTLVFIFIMICMMFVAGANPKLMAGIFGGGLAFIFFYIWGFLKFGWYLPLKQHQLNRILVVIDPNIDPRGVGWNVIQSKIAVGSGGFLGKGVGSGTQGMGEFLPEQWTDFIFAVLAEELGFVGAGLLLVLFFVVLYRALQIAASSKDLFGSLIAVGICSMFFFHILENIGMCIGIMPVTGIPLPFVSYGGSSMLSNMIGIALLLNIYVNRQRIIF